MIGSPLCYQGCLLAAGFGFLGFTKSVINNLESEGQMKPNVVNALIRAAPNTKDQYQIYTGKILYVICMFYDTIFLTISFK